MAALRDDTNPTTLHELADSLKCCQVLVLSKSCTENCADNSRPFDTSNLDILSTRLDSFTLNWP